MSLHRLTPRGISEMNLWLDAIHNRPATAVPEELVNPGAFVEATGFGDIAEPRLFGTRFEWASYAQTLTAGVPDTQVQSDTGMWCWLTLVYFDQLCPSVKGVRKLGQRARYVPTGTDFRTYYRHLLAGPWQILTAHRDAPERARAVLGGSLHTPGEVYEQIASRMELATSATVLSLSNALYLDATTGKRKRGAGSAGPGTPRRLADVLMQLDLTFDIYAMPMDKLLRLLPNEFERFKQ
jgi:hypothetical protein